MTTREYLALYPGGDPKIGHHVEIIQGKENWAEGMNKFVGSHQIIANVIEDRQGLYFTFKDDPEGINWYYWRAGMHFKPYKITLKLTFK